MHQLSPEATRPELVPVETASATEVAARVRSFLPLLGIVAVMGVNAIANVVTINGYRTGQVSDLYPTGFTPAGWVFSIWSFIYIALLGYAGAQAWGSESVRARGAVVRPLFLVNACANIGWLLAWHHRQIELSFAIMLVVLATLIAAHVKLRALPRAPLSYRLFVDAPFSLYFGWITTATIANFGAACSARHAFPFGLTMDQWALVSVVFAIVVYVALTLYMRDAIFGAVFVWASLGIYLKRTGITPTVQHTALVGTVLVGAVVLSLVVRAALSSRARNPAAEQRPSAI